MRRVLLLFLFGTLTAFGQEFTPDYVEYHSEYTPVTPNASTFMIYGNTPVNHSTGVPQISIPIHTIVEDGVTIPISISYHASGVKVDELSSVVGLKWTLNAGGGIFRQANDRPDEDGWLVPSKRGSIDPTWLSNHNLYDLSTQNSISNSDQNEDYYPDDFSFNFLGRSGSFIFDLNGQVAHEFQDAMKIDTIALVNNHFDFKAKDGLGNTFYFDGDKEQNTTVTTNVTGLTSLDMSRTTNVSGWMLDRVVTKNGKQIDWTYEQYDLDYTIVGLSHSLTHARGCDTDGEISQCGCMGADVSESAFSTTPSTTSVRYTPSNKLVKTIETSTTKVTFNYADDTTLATWQRKLTSIDILDKIANKTKSFLFTYGKFSGDPRLRLDEVQEVSFGGEYMPPHKFTYMAGNLPAKGSYAKDHSGYYNGKTGNQTLVPFSLLAYNTLNLIDRAKLADRKEDINYLKIGALKSVKYPTGGSTEFTYEPNTQSDPNALNGNHVSISETASTLSYEHTYVNGSYTHFVAYLDITADQTTLTYSTDSSICDFNNSIDCSAFNIYPATESNGTYTVDYNSPIFTPTDKLVGAQGNVFVDTGSYAVELKVETSDLNANPGADISVGIDWMAPDPNNTFYTGGLRVKTVVDKDTGGQAVKTTNYTYEDLEGYAPSVSDHTKSYASNNRRVFSSNNISLNPALTKSGHYYKKVTIDQVGTTENITTKEYFEHTLRNKNYEPVMTKQEMLKDGQRVRTTLMEYDNTLLSQLDHYILADKEYCYANPSNGPEVLGYSGVETAHYYLRRHVLAKRTVVDHLYEQFVDSFAARVNVVEYFYNGNMQLITQKLDGRYSASSEQDIENGILAFDANGEYGEIRLTYANNHTTEDTQMATFNTDYLIALPVSKKVYKDGELIQGQFAEFDSDGNVTASYRYNKGAGTNSSSAGYIPSDYERHATYTLLEGMPVDIKREDGTSTALLWDTTETYLLAEVQNATKAQLDALIPISINLATTTNAQLLTHYDTIRQGLPDAMVTTYTYDPMVGVTSITDPRGHTSYFEYDVANRLKQVKDADGNLISKNDYNYREQN